MQVTVDIQNVVDSANEIPQFSDFENWVTSALEQGGYKQESAELTIRIVDSQESQQLNHEYRDKDKPTNVLSFPFEAPPGIPCDLLGDLIICQAVVEKEAKEQSKLTHNHWAHLVIHGTLHLLGYDHIENAEALEMEAIEILSLAKFQINNPYEME